jgi:hypothetical protein
MASRMQRARLTSALMKARANVVMYSGGPTLIL